MSLVVYMSHTASPLQRLPDTAPVDRRSRACDVRRGARLLGPGPGRLLGTVVRTMSHDGAGL